MNHKAAPGKKLLFWRFNCSYNLPTAIRPLSGQSRYASLLGVWCCPIISLTAVGRWLSKKALFAVRAPDIFFLLAGQLVYVTWSCSFIIGWWEVKNLYMILELGRSPLCTVKRETSWWKLRKTKFGSWTRSNSKKQGRGPPGTQAPPGQVPGDTAKEKTSQTTTWSNLQLLDYIHSTASCRNMLQLNENGEILQDFFCSQANWFM